MEGAVDLGVPTDSFIASAGGGVGALGRSDMSDSFNRLESSLQGETHGQRRVLKPAGNDVCHLQREVSPGAHFSEGEQKRGYYYLRDAPTNTRYSTIRHGPGAFPLAQPARRFLVQRKIISASRVAGGDNVAPDARELFPTYN